MTLTLFGTRYGRLAVRVVAEVHASKLSGQLVLRRQQYTLRPDFSLMYTADAGILNFDAEDTEEEEWHPKDEEAFLAERVLKLAEYTRVLQLLQGAACQDAGILRGFVWRGVYGAATCDAADCESHVETVLRQELRTPN